MKITIVSHSYLEPEMHKNLAELARLVDVQWVTPRRARGVLRREVSYLPDETDGGRRKPLRAFRPFGRQYVLLSPDLGLKKFRPDIIHVEYEPWSLIFLQYALYRRVWAPRARLVCTAKKNTYRAYPGLAGRMKRILATAGIGRTDYFLTTSKLTSELYEEIFHVPPDRVAVVPRHGFDVELFRPANVARPRDASTLTVGFTGRLHEEKGVSDLVDAVERCRSEAHLDVRLRLLGSGPLKEKLAASSSERPWLEVHDAVPNRDVSRFLQDLDVFVMPSRVFPDHQEHDGRALVEALAVGLPTVGTRSGVIPDILGDGTGLVVDSNSSEALAGAIRELALDEDLRRVLSERARRKAESVYSVAQVARQKVEVYRKVLDERT